MASYEKFFKNTISITGLSKSYGLASLRAGMVIADESIIRGIRNYIFQTMDSSPLMQGKALGAAFNASPERYKEYDAYFNPIIDEYKYRLELLKALVEGLDVVEDKKIRLEIEKDIKKYINSDHNLKDLLNGIPGVHFVKNSIPESGFFELLDYTELKGKEADGRVITDEIELLKYMYEQQKIKIILGQSISYPNPDQLIGRVTTALERDELIDHMGAMNKCLRKLR
jgi:aspartate/methionine/tyrosine aminotransferase